MTPADLALWAAAVAFAVVLAALATIVVALAVTAVKTAGKR